MLVLGLLNILLGGVVGWRCQVMTLAPLSLFAGVEGLLWSLPSLTWTAIAWDVGVVVFFLDIGYLTGKRIRGLSARPRIAPTGDFNRGRAVEAIACSV
jgi:hypothetical protein